jgi:hypothetical protein
MHRTGPEGQGMAREVGEPHASKIPRDRRCDERLVVPRVDPFVTGVLFYVA